MNINMASMIGGYTADRFELNMGHVNLWLYVHIIILDVCRVYIPILHNYVQVYMLLCNHVQLYMEYVHMCMDTGYKINKD